MKRSDTGPFAIVPEWVLSVGLSSRAIHLYAVLSRFADRHDEAWPLRATLAERLNTTMKSIDRATTELKRAQALSVQPRKDQNGQHSNLYTVHRVDPRGSILSPPLDTGVSPPATLVSPITRTNERDTSTSYLSAAAKATVTAITDEWWCAHTPRPAQPYIAVLKVVEHALAGGWGVDDLRQALTEVPTVSGSTLDFWRNRDRTRPKTPTQRSHENMLRYLARNDGEARSPGGPGAVPGELGARGDQRADDGGLV